MNTHHPPRVLLADGDADVRRALTLLLQTALGLHVVGEAADLTGLAANDREQADLLLVDWPSIGPDAAQVLARLRSLSAHLRVIVLSTRPEDAAAALAAGADAFISKVDPPQQVLATVHAVVLSVRSINQGGDTSKRDDEPHAGSH
jgi:DNA-binding NarL/FixJ family response regulator